MAGARSDTWMPLYVGDYLRDTMHLTTEQHGAYLLLIMAAWTGSGTLLDDDDFLASTAKLSKSVWKKSRKVYEAFFEINNGVWTHKRIGTELEKARRTTEAKSIAGRKGAAKRWPSQPKSNGKGITEPCSSHRQADTPSPSPKEVSTSSLRSDDAGASIPLGFLKPVDGDWKALLFSSCLKWLVLVYEEKPGKLRGLLGLWLKDCRDDAEKLVGLLAECQRENRADPKAWITACLQENRDETNRSGARPSKAERAKAAVQRAAVAGGYAGEESQSETGTGDDAVSVLSGPETVRQGTGGA